MHDVVAHSLTVSLLHVSSARLAVEDDPAGAAAALAEAERLGRAALGEVRQTVALLREGPAATGGGAPDPPLPGADRVGELVDQVRRAGVDVRFTSDPLPAHLSATTGLALYRVLQEALTNAARHAPGRPTTVTIGVAGDAVELQARTDGAGAGAAGPRRSGTGLGSMRERARAVGGSCTAGPDAADGWTVRARFPVPAPAPSPAPSPVAP